MANLIFIDTETTGLGANAAVIEIAAIAYIDGERKEAFQSYIRPHEGATLDPEAFRVNGINIKEVWSFPDAKSVIQKFLEYVDQFECIFAISGHNVGFDLKRLFNLFCRNGEYGSYLNRFRSGGLCTLKIAKAVFKGKRHKPTGFSLEKLCEFYEIEKRNYHSALPDIQATIDVYEALLPSIPKAPTKALENLNYQEMRRKYMDMRYVQINPEGDVFLTKEALHNDKIRRFIFTELDYLFEEDTTSFASDESQSSQEAS